MDPCFWSIDRLAQALDRREISGRELWALYESRITRLNPILEAFRERLPFHEAGIPLTVKESFSTNGARQALCVQRLRAAGAGLLGTTTAPKHLLDWETPGTRNAWNPARSPGGSSGGEAVAIAAGMSAGGMGSDGGGSIRLPAALNGICGLKPTPGRVPGVGHSPPVGMPGGLLGVVGPMGRTVADVEWLFRAVAGHADADPFSIPFTPAKPTLPDRIGVVAHEHCAAAMAWGGFTFAEFPQMPWERMFQVWRFFFLRVNGWLVGEPTRHTAALLEEPPPTAVEMAEMFAARDALRLRMLAAMDSLPVVLMPCPGFGAWEQGEFPGVEAMAPLVYANLLGLPALALPAGLDHNGMPFGVQLIAKPWQEELLLAVGAKMEEARGAFGRPPWLENA
jgi:Asp-tRNA(Asn)/Glu-tRNA(Gln) amidotransferase A subunit family amidase